MSAPGPNELRVAIIGFGMAGQIYHAPLIDALDGLSVAAVVTGNADRAQLARDSYRGVEVFATLTELFDNADHIDMAVVATPNSTHAPCAIAAIERGIPTVVDKPFARTVAEAETIVAAATQHGTLLSVYHNRRWDGDFLTVSALVRDWRLGDSFRFESRIDRWVPTVSDGWREAASPETAGGMLYDLGSHLIDQALILFGPATSVYAETAVQRHGAGIDDDFFVSIQHASGQRSHLGACLTALRPAPRFRLTGTAATYVKEGSDPQGEQIKAGIVPRSRQWGVYPAGQDGMLYLDGEHIPVPTTSGDYCTFYEKFRDAVLGVGENPVTPASATAVLRVIEAAHHSAATGAVVHLDQVTP